MKILILGHTGMLGNALRRFFSQKKDCEVLTISSRYPNTEFLEAIKTSGADFIINCVGAIPQKKPSSLEYRLLNEDLPKELDKIGIPIVHPSTDCEFSGQLRPPHAYDRTHDRDAKDEYGQSKARISEWIEHNGKNTKIIRTSILGHELTTSHSLLDWFLSQTTMVNGYTDQYWNGVTTLEWATQCFIILKNWNDTGRLTQLATPACVSKHSLLTTIKNIYGKDIEVRPFLSGNPVNKCLISDLVLPEIEMQLRELRTFYGK